MNQQLPIDRFMQFLANPTNMANAASGTAKFFVMFAFTLYLVFGLVVIRQAQLMTKTIDTPLTPTIKLVSYIHMVAAAVVWLFAFAVL